MFEQARGIVRDFRKHDFADDQRLYAPVGFSLAYETHLNIDRLIDLVGNDYPDQELFSHLRGGVRFKAELSLALIMFPHLTSLLVGFSRAEKYVRRFEDIGWYSG